MLNVIEDGEFWLQREVDWLKLAIAVVEISNSLRQS